MKDCRNNTAILQEDRMELLLRSPFLGRILFQCELRFVTSPEFPLSGNDCRRIFLAEKLYCSLPREKRIEILMHELLHIALRHAFRCGSRDQQRFSFAADAEIYFLMKEEFSLPENPSFRKSYQGLLAEEIYEKLPKSLPEKPQKHFYPLSGKMNLLPGASGSGEKRNQLTQNEEGDCREREEKGKDKNGNPVQEQEEEGDEDDKELHRELNEESRSKKEEKGNNGDFASGGNKKGDSKEDYGKKDGTIPAEAEGNGYCNDSSSHNGNEPGEDPAEESLDPVPNFDVESELFSYQIATELRLEVESSSGQGNLAGNLQRYLQEVTSKPRNWRTLLRQFLKKCRGGNYHWLPPNRRFISRGLYLPGKSQQIFRGIVALDTSGSTAGVLSGFVADVEDLMRSFGRFELTIIECDAQIGNVTRISSYTPPMDWQKHRFSGGGGTDFTPVFQYIENQRLMVNVLIFFTDGLGTCPRKAPPYPVLWLLTEGGEAPVPWGVTVEMKGEKYGNHWT